jgi:SHS2 domain-containing protein
MPYAYLEHISDVGIHAEAETLEKASEAAAEAMLNVMFERPAVEETIAITFGVDAADIPALFVEMLNELLSIQDRHGLAIKRLKTVEIKKTPRGYRFMATAYGEALDIEKHGIKTEVKAATYSGLLYKEDEGKHIFECVLDV